MINYPPKHGKFFTCLISAFFECSHGMLLVNSIFLSFALLIYARYTQNMPVGASEEGSMETTGFGLDPPL